MTRGQGLRAESEIPHSRTRRGREKEPPIISLATKYRGTERNYSANRAVDLRRYKSLCWQYLRYGERWSRHRFAGRNFTVCEIFPP